jgi:protein-S-isoprenylcysteine O-methyltransferase Ste14
MMYLAIFIAFSILLLVFTLHRPHRHRFVRFFAFEFTLALIVLNADSWFVNPTSVRQIVSWLLLICSFLLAWHGFWLLRSYGDPEDDLENTTQLVTRGVYRFIRHPLYGSLLLLGLGAFLKSPSGYGLLLLIFLFSFVYITGKVEEKENLKRFGQVYADYMGATKMFIPHIL